MATSADTGSLPGSSSQPRNGLPPQALVELEIPGGIGPLPSGEWGINLGAAQENFPNNGLQLYISAWPQMGIGDSVKVLLDGTAVTNDNIDADEVGQRVTTFIAPERLRDGSHVLSYSVARFGMAPEPSAETKIFVKLTRPGGKDQNGDVPGHSELHLSLPDRIINDGVDAESAKAGVPATIKPYPNMTAGDDITLSWGGQFVHHLVTADEVGQDIVIRVEEAVILAAGDSDNSGLAVVFQVLDIVHNRSEDWSAEIRIVTRTSDTFLEAPIVEETFNNVLNLDTLGDKPVTVQVWVTAATEDDTPADRRFIPGDQITVRVTGTTVEGEAVLYEAPPFPVENIPHTYEVWVPNAVVRRLAKTQAVFSYRLLREDGLTLTSRGQFVNVIGEAARLAAPIALDASQGALDPDLTSTTVQVPWDDAMAAGDRITLKWVGTRPDLSIYDPELPPHDITNGEASRQEPIDFTVAGSHLKAIEGGTLELHYVLASIVDGAIVERESAHSSPLIVGTPRAELPAPIVAGVVDGAMDPALPGTTLTVPIYPTMAVGDEVHYLWDGDNEDSEDWLTLNAFTVDKPVVFQIPAKAIANNDGSTVKAAYWIIRASGRRSDSEVLTFTVGEVEEEVLPQITRVVDSNNTEIPDNGTTTDTRVTLSGVASAGKEVEVLDGAMSRGKVSADASGKWTLDLSGLSVGTHGIRAIALYGSGAESAVRSFTVAAAIAPTITSVKDSNGEVANCGTTYDTSVTVTGTASAGEQVEVFDGAASQGKVTVDAGGKWTLALSDLSEAPHSIKAKALYGSGAESEVRSFTVAAAIAPTITSVKDSNGEVANGGTTYETSLTVTGTANSGEQVEVFDGAISMGKATVDASGEWTLALNDLSLAAHSIKAWALYSSGTESAVYSFTVIARLKLPAPIIVEAIDTTLNPADVLDGAHVRIGAGAQLKVGDQVTLTWAGQPGQGSVTLDKTADADGRLLIDISYATVKANDGFSVELSYTIKRQGGATEGPSPLSVYDVQEQVAAGLLKLMGSRFTRSPYRYHYTPRRISAFNASTGKAMEVEWQYEGDTAWSPLASSWRDTRSDLPLRARTRDELVTLNPANIISTYYAHVAHRDTGDMIGWGVADYGASIPSNIITLQDIVEVSCTLSAYAARRVNNQVVTWGNSAEGGSLGGLSPNGFAAVIGASRAFAGLLTSGKVVAWGEPTYGAVVPPAIASLTDIVQVTSNVYAFAAIRATGQVVAWGRSEAGGTVPAPIATLTDIVEVLGNSGAFVALRKNGSVVAWGGETSGSHLPPDIALLTDIAELGSTNSSAFSVIRKNGSVVAWGNANFGGAVPVDIAVLNDIVEVSANVRAFAARRANGHVVAWGDEKAGSIVPGDIAALDDIVQVVGASQAFAALRSNGTVVAWGDKGLGGDITSVAGKLKNVQAIYGNHQSFVALTSDGEVVTWGHVNSGGDSSSVQAHLRGRVSYLATPASRGLALNARRRIGTCSGPHPDDEA